MFYMGKELEDEKSLAAQNVQPNSLVHLIRTKVYMWPWAQRLPGENKSLRPPGALKKKSDLSTKDGHVILMEYYEERLLMLSNWCKFVHILSEFIPRGSTCQLAAQSK
ncbi:Ubiquitin domain [Arabidopsis thaliana x Arabidopsis arenosa]|uniref:Ubiquitin domain n=1 Tax=Arabidopsis thaliana x Arabidopsis arenosa TaxID=1240361 RepID=A0A8T1ZM50_9BRAS|nr:Ubiquitin domain [Arabidopsis thaliana x Arabidopsis arenosa]KAG7559495.1 Ubiquitin domain [Arabidopsis thaliana x Arabidopsis arenosa]